MIERPTLRTESSATQTSVGVQEKQPHTPVGDLAALPISIVAVGLLLMSSMALLGNGRRSKNP